MSPAPGFRDSGSYGGCGTLYGVGDSGYKWSSTIPAKDIKAHYLFFCASKITPNFNNDRAYGLQLRCLQE